MGTIFNVDVIREEMQSADWMTIESGCVEERSVYLGSIFALTPSGKFYTPWANSNVTICQACVEHGPDFDGATCGNDACGGKCCEAHADALWWGQAESELDAAGYSLESGEGDPCDLFAIECRLRED